MKHIIFTRIKFPEDKRELMDKYLAVCKGVLVPALNAQTVQAFEWVILTNPAHDDYLKGALKHPFTPVHSIEEFVSYCRKSNAQIQTRHDCDDYMSPKYVERIQDIARQKIGRLRSFLIQSQPVKENLKTGKVTNLAPYTKARCSMHLTLVQRELKYNIWDDIHARMGRFGESIYTIKGYTKWVIHGDNISVNRGLKA